MKQKKPLSSYVEMLRTMIAILISLIIVFAIILLISSQPLSALGDFIFGPLTSVRRFGNVIEGSVHSLMRVSGSPFSPAHPSLSRYGYNPDG